jgi:hypothetical protein
VTGIPLWVLLPLVALNLCADGREERVKRYALPDVGALIENKANFIDLWQTIAAEVEIYE